MGVVPRYVFRFGAIAEWLVCDGRFVSRVGADGCYDEW